jgi:hypothetical protein
MGNDFNDFPSGKYTGVFIFDSFPALNFTKEFVGTKSKVNIPKARKYIVKFNFIDFSTLDSVQFRIGVYGGNSQITSKYGGYIPYDVSIYDNTIVGKQTPQSDSTLNLEYASSFTLTYTP